MAKIIKKISQDKKAIVGTTPKPSAIFSEEGSGVLNKSVLDAKGKAKAIIDEACVTAEKIRNEARDALSRIEKEREKAKKDGFNAGREEGLQSVAEMALSLETTREQFYNNAEPEMIKLVLMISEKVIGKLVRENQQAIKSIVHQAVESSLGERIVVRLNPEDHKAVTADEPALRDILDRTKRISFKEDEAITKGGCIVETEVGTIDARLETQLKAIKKALEL